MGGWDLVSGSSALNHLPCVSVGVFKISELPAADRVDYFASPFYVAHIEFYDGSLQIFDAECEV